MGIKKILAAAVTAGMLLSFTPAVSMADSAVWIKDGEFWRYYTYEDGYVTYDWKKIDGKWYFFTYEGYMVSGADNVKIEDKFYDFKSNGECTNPEGKSKLPQGWNRIVYSFGYSVITRKYEKNSGWVYADKNGDLYKGWHFIGGSWYYFDEYSGIMYSCSGRYAGPKWIDGCNYWFKESGEMVTGWYYGGGYWRYAASDGVLFESRWLKDDGKSYYFDWDGRMLCNAANYKINGKYYSFDSSGACINPEGSDEIIAQGWYKKASGPNSYSWYYMGEDGKHCTGWQKIDGKWYFFRGDGSMTTGILQTENGDYCFKDNGEMVTGWYKYQSFDSKYWIYAGSNGKVYKDRWLNSGGKWYYFTSWWMMVSDVKNYTIDGIDYNFDSSGVCTNPNAKAKKITGWCEKPTRYGHVTGSNEPRWIYYWYYYDKDGNMYTDKWLNSGSKWYYFDVEGRMASGGSVYIESDNKVYDFDSNGVCLNPYNGREPNLS